MSEPQYGAGPEQPGQPSLNKPDQGDGGPGQPPPAYGAPQQPQQPSYGAPQQGGPPQGYGQPGPPQGYAGPQAELNPAEQRQWAMLGHLGGIILWWLSGLIVYLMYKDRGAFVRDQATEALNFQITFSIAMIASWIISALTFGFLFFLPFVVWIGLIVFAIMAGMAANNGQNYRYPVNIRMVK